MKKRELWYWCACCQKMVCHAEGPHYLDNGTQLFCPECNGTTIVEFRMASWEKTTRDALDRVGDSILAETPNER